MLLVNYIFLGWSKRFLSNLVNRNLSGLGLYVKDNINTVSCGVFFSVPEILSLAKTDLTLPR